MGQNLIMNMNDHGFVVGAWLGLFPLYICSTFLFTFNPVICKPLTNRSVLTIGPCPRCTTSYRMRRRAPRWLEQSLWRTWCPNWRSPGGSSCWSRLDRRLTTSSINWSVMACWTELKITCENLNLAWLKLTACAASSVCQVPLLEAGDIIIDGGNSEYRDTTVGHREPLLSNERGRSHSTCVFLLYSGVARVWKRKGCCLLAVESVVERMGPVMDPLLCQEDIKMPGEFSLCDLS